MSKLDEHVDAMSDLKKDTPSESASFALLPATDSTNQALALQKKGITLSRLLAGVSLSVAEAFKGGVWTLVEVVEARPCTACVSGNIGARRRRQSARKSQRDNLSEHSPQDSA